MNPREQTYTKYLTIILNSESRHMTPFLQLAFLIAMISLTAKLGGFLSTRLGQPAVLGELIIGLIRAIST